MRPNARAGRATHHGRRGAHGSSPRLRAGRKPDGLLVVPPDATRVSPSLPVERLWGVGPVTADKLHHRGILTVGESPRSPSHLDVDPRPWMSRHLHALAHSQIPARSSSGAAALDRVPTPSGIRHDHPMKSTPSWPGSSTASAPARRRPCRAHRRDPASRDDFTRASRSTRSIAPRPRPNRSTPRLRRCWRLPLDDRAARPRSWGGGRQPR